MTIKTEVVVVVIYCFRYSTYSEYYHNYKTEGHCYDA